MSATRSSRAIIQSSFIRSFGQVGTSNMILKKSYAVQILLTVLLLDISTTFSSIQPAPANPYDQVVLSSHVLPKKLTPQLWDALRLDDYIRNYPQGNTTSVQEFARQNGASNFHCGIGEKCNVGELSYPVQGLAWYALFAIQEFNLFMNSIHQAVGTTMDLIRFTTASLLMDLVKPPHKPSHKNQIIFDMLFFMSTITISLAFGLFVSMGTLAVDSAWWTVAEISAYLGTVSTASVTIMTMDSMIKSATQSQPETVFDYWAQFAFYFSKLQSSMQQGISDSLRQTLDGGISSAGPNSIATILSHGSFIQPRAKKSLPEIEASLKEVTQIRALVILLRSMNAFITRGGEPCKGRGLNGARDETNHLSFCGADGVMMNIVTVHGDKIENEIYNAKSIAFKYRITAEYLTTKSFECQTKHGIYFDPYERSALPMDPNSECLVNLPVCDFTRPDVAEAIRQTDIVKACRQVGKLKI